MDLSPSRTAAATSSSVPGTALVQARQRGPAEAAPLADEYLKRFPNGPHATVARELSSE